MVQSARVCSSQHRPLLPPLCTLRVRYTCMAAEPPQSSTTRHVIVACLSVMNAICTKGQSTPVQSCPLITDRYGSIHSPVGMHAVPRTWYPYIAYSACIASCRISLILHMATPTVRRVLRTLRTVGVAILFAHTVLHTKRSKNLVLKFL